MKLLQIIRTSKSSSIKGVAMVEIIVASAIIASSFVAILGIYATLSTLSLRALPKMQAAMLAGEAVEALRSMRDAGYAANIGALSTSGTYYLTWTQGTSQYSATTSVVAIDNTFYRTIQIANVYRDGSYNIAPSGTLDADTKRATITVSWKDGNATSTYALQSYIFNTFDN